MLKLAIPAVTAILAIIIVCEDFSLNDECLAENVIYKTSLNYDKEENIYFGSLLNSFKTRLYSLKMSLSNV